MPIETWAEREDYTGPPAGMIKCPCCGKARTADSVVLLPPHVRTVAIRRFHQEVEPEYACTAALSTLVRERLITKDQLPNRKSP